MKVNGPENEFVVVMLVAGIGHVVGHLVEDGPAAFGLACPGVLILGEGQASMAELVPGVYANRVAPDSVMRVPKALVLWHGGATAPVAGLWRQYTGNVAKAADMAKMASALDPAGPLGVAAP